MLWFNDENISIILSQKSDGDLLFKAQTRADDTQNNAEILNEKIRQNRVSFFEKNNIDAERLVNYVAEHNDFIHIIYTADLNKGAFNPITRISCDGLISNIKNSYLMITGADCFPVFFYDPAKNVIAAAHCGWQGVLKELPAKMISEFVSDFGSNPTDIQVWIGPGIKSCHFEVKSDVAGLFEKNFKSAIMNKDAKIYIDLAKIMALQLTEAGVKPENITTHPDCTYCEKDKYFSYRRDKPKIVEANAFIINLKRDR